MRVAITNRKGGTGKTTTAVHLAAGMARCGVPALLVDLDPQASATRWAGVEPSRALADALEAAAHGDRFDLAAAVMPAPGVPGLDVLPGSPRLAVAERELSSAPGGDVVLRELLDTLPGDRWRHLVMDCPPSLGRLSLSALVAADGAVVPVEASTLALEALADLVQTVAALRRRGLNPALRLLAVTAVRVDARQRIGRAVVERLREQFGEAATVATIRERVVLREAAGQRRTVYDLDPAGDAAADYQALTAEILERLEAGR